MNAFDTCNPTSDVDDQCEIAESQQDAGTRHSFVAQRLELHGRKECQLFASGLTLQE